MEEASGYTMRNKDKEVMIEVLPRRVTLTLEGIDWLVSTFTKRNETIEKIEVINDKKRGLYIEVSPPRSKTDSTGGGLMECENCGSLESKEIECLEHNSGEPTLKTRRLCDKCNEKRLEVYCFRNMAYIQKMLGGT